MPRLPHAHAALPFVALACALAGCGSSGTTATPTSTTAAARPSDTGAAQKIFVVTPGSAGADVVGSFSATACGEMTPATVLTGPATSSIRGIAVDGNQAIYTSNASTTASSSFLGVYTAGSTTAARTIQGSSTQLGYPGTLTVDAAGNLLVNQEAAVFLFGSAATGNVAPTASLIGGTSLVYYPSQVYSDAAGNVLVGQQYGTAVNGGSSGVLVFTAGVTSTSAPARSIIGTATTIGRVYGACGDKAGNLYVVGPNATGAALQVAAFAPGANGNVAPARVISGSSTKLAQSGNCAADGAGNVYVVNYPGTGGSYITIFNAASSGNAAPASTITTAAGLYGKSGLIAIY